MSVLNIALCMAVEAGDLQTCVDLLNDGADPNARRPNSDSALSLAAASGYAAICSLLISSGADIHAEGIGDASALEVAASRGKVDACRVLLDAGAIAGAQSWRAQESLKRAAENGYAEVCTLLLDSGADVDSKTLGGRSALECAAALGAAEVCALLIERGATRSGRALMSAAEYGHVGAVDVLLADSDFPAAVLRRALDNAVTKGFAPICSALIEKGARPELSDLVVAVRKGHVAVCEVLIRYGLSVNGRDSTRRPMLHVAAVAGALETARCLLDNGADVNIEADKPGWTPLYQTIQSASAQSAEMCRLLVAYGANTKPECQNPGDLTPFQYAITTGSARVVKCLADVCGEDPYQLTVRGETMLELASDWREVVHVLRALMTEYVVDGALGGADNASPSPRRSSEPGFI